MLRTARLAALALLTTTAACATAGRQGHALSATGNEGYNARYHVNFVPTEPPADAWDDYVPAPAPRSNALANAALILGAAAAGGAAAIQPPALVHRTVVCVGGICSIY